jgi:hypothetical protein
LPPFARDRRRIALLLALIFAVAGPSSAAHAAASLEASVKAAFVSRFASFVAWPGPPRSRINLCVLDEPAAAQLVADAGSGAAQLRPLSVRAVSSVGAGAGCDMLYALGTHEQTAAAALEAVRGQPVLTITDASHGAAKGMVHFVISEGRVRFQIDQGQASRTGLSVSSKLLALALSVKK